MHIPLANGACAKSSVLIIPKVFVRRRDKCLHVLKDDHLRTVGEKYAVKALATVFFQNRSRSVEYVEMIEAAFAVASPPQNSFRIVIRKNDTLASPPFVSPVAIPHCGTRY